MKANSFNEWAPLREVVVGTSAGYEAHELELSFRLFFNDVAHSSFYYPSLDARHPFEAGDSRRDLNHRYVEELAEDVEEFEPPRNSWRLFGLSQAATVAA